MANPEHLAILKQGVEAWNAWYNQHRAIELDLTNPTLSIDDVLEANLAEIALNVANLSGANLRGANLCGAILVGANLRGANLRGAILVGANLADANLSEATLVQALLSGVKFAEAKLRGADLAGADLSGANLRGADLREAKLSRTDLNWADLARADLRGANLSEVRLYETVFGDTNLTAVRGLETCDHRGPSILDHRTLVKSGPLPLAFLRGCGLPDMLIDYLPSLLNEPFQFYSCFISYSSVDEDFCRRLHGRLQDAGLRVWFAPHDIQGGRKLHEQIDQAIRVYDKLLLVLSPHSMQSPWVEFEIRRARKREVAEQRRLLFPIRLVNYEALKVWECFDADTAKDLAAEIREYYIPDFTAWKEHDVFEAAVARLLQDLKTEAKPSHG
jgi:hypothetical protein